MKIVLIPIESPNLLKKTTFQDIREKALQEITDALYQTMITPKLAPGTYSESIMLCDSRNIIKKLINISAFKIIAKQ